MFHFWQPWLTALSRPTLRKQIHGHVAKPFHIEVDPMWNQSKTDLNIYSVFVWLLCEILRTSTEETKQSTIIERTPRILSPTATCTRTESNLEHEGGWHPNCPPTQRVVALTSSQVAKYTCVSIPSGSIHAWTKYGPKLTSRDIHCVQVGARAMLATANSRPHLIQRSLQILCNTHLWVKARTPVR